MSDSNTGHCFTPTHTTFSHEDHDSQSASLYLSPPLANKTFLIRHPQTSLVVTLKGDKLCLHPLDITNTNCQWRIIETASGWLGFRNIHSDTYIRHNNSWSSWNWKFVADVKHHDLWEYFTTRPGSNGRHELRVKHWFGFRGMRLGGEEGRELVVAEHGEKGVAWEFIKVG
ncbi:hypothetical protein HAV15_008321 [Penicillium sp. str. |nr:hypothetical protein HAV15_008321 [Penicillium sp. str. \